MYKKGFVFLLVLLLVLSLSITVSAWWIFGGDEEVTISSPNGQIKLVFQLNKGMPNYKVCRGNINLVNSSSLGFEFAEERPLNKNFEILNTSTEEFNNTWQPVWGQRSQIKNHYKQLTVKLKEKKAPHRKMNLVFRVYNDGVGFRYELPKQKNLADKIEIMFENTEFSLASNNTSWWIPNDWDSYEYTYNETLLSEVEEVSTPFTMKTPEGIYLSIHEAALVDYAGMALKRTKGNTLESDLCPWPDGVKVKATLPLKTPWRTIQIGENAGDLIESDLIVNLNQPNVIEDTSWIKPMKYMGIWWEMHIDKSDWGRQNNNHGATTENAKHYIDFAYNHLIKGTDNQKIGFLVEGWNQGWDGNWIDNCNLFKFIKDGEYDDFDLSEVVNYGRKRGIEYIAHNETSGGIEHYEKQLDAAYADYQRLGIHGIKSGYVADNGIHQPKGQHHHGQYMVNHYNNAVKKAAKYQIMIDTHEPIKATGLRRTYPNWMAREGVQGMEYNAWSAGNPPEHTTILPFTRVLGGPIDYTPGIFDVKIENKPNNRVHTTRAKQLALYVTLFSPIQMVTDLPENYVDENDKILPEFKFIQDIPCDWNETLVLNAEIGDYLTIVRKSKGKDEWYIGSITDENARDLDIKLDFLEQGKKYVAEIYSDGSKADWKTNPEAVTIDKVLVDADDTLVASLATSGGQAIRLYPASKEEIATVSEYKAPEIKVSYINVPESVRANDDFKIKLNVMNKGSLITSKELKLYDNGKIVAKKKVRVAPGSNKKLVFSYPDFFKVGDHQVRVDDLANQTVKVIEREPTFNYSNLDVLSAGKDITVKVAVSNFGSHPGVADVKLYLDGEVVKTKKVEVPAKAGGASKEVEFDYKLSNNGAYEITVDKLEPQVVGVPDIDLAGKWLFKKGDDLSWKDPQFDDSDWQKINLPASWESHSDYTTDNVYGWYRKELTIPEEWKGYSLKITLGKIDDVDQTFFNGQKIGESGKFPTGEDGEGMQTAWGQVREYIISAEVINYGRKNVITIRVFDGVGGGGLYDGPVNSIKLIKSNK